MKTFTSLLIAGALTLAGAVMAQEPTEQGTPPPKGAVQKGKGQAQTEGQNAVRGKGVQKELKPAATAAPEGGAINKRTESRVKKMEATPKSTSSTASNASGEPGVTATPAGKIKGGKAGRETKAAKATATPATSTTPASANAKTTATPTTNKAMTSATPAASATPVGATGQNKVAAAKKPDAQKVEQIKSQHSNFKAQPKPDKVPAVTFNQNHRIEGADRWQGTQYEAFRSYRPERHDEGWYRSHYTRIELIGGGYYYWNAGYWYPAWGYNPSSEYYAYDGPIYVGQRAEPADHVIADVQAELQEMGYYKGEVDGLLGPLTREALSSYQADQGLTTTAAIDEPTLDSLGMS